MSSHAAPSAAAGDALHRAAAYTKLRRKLPDTLSRSRASENLRRLFVRQSRLSVSLSASEYVTTRASGDSRPALGCLSVNRPLRHSVSPLVSHVSHVGGMGSRKQVIRAHAQGVVAAMADLDASGDRAVRDLPTDTMSAGGGLSARTGDLSVSLPVYGRAPQPASVRLLDLLPETLSQRSCVSTHTHHRISTLRHPRLP